MKLTEFSDYHTPALEADEVRHNLILGVLARALSAADGFLFWTLGAPGECAIKAAKYGIVLGAPSKLQCQALAQLARDVNYPSVVGTGETALWFAAQAEALGCAFAEKIPQQIQVLRSPPTHTGVPGFARQASAEDYGVFRNWTLSFIAEAVPHDPIPSDEAMRDTLAQRRHRLWIAGGKPVSMAAVARRTKYGASINSVFTPPEFRNEGFAGAITSAVARELFSNRLPLHRSSQSGFQSLLFQARLPAGVR